MKSIIPTVRTANRTDEDMPRLRLGIYEGLVVKDNLLISKYSGHSYKMLQIRLDNGRMVWATIPRHRISYSYLGLRITADCRKEEEYDGHIHIHVRAYLGKWDDFGGY